MFKLGICRKQQLTPDRLKGFVNRRKLIALDLYNSLDHLSKADIDRVQEHMLRRFPVGNGVMKRTHARRFDDFDRLSLSAITANFPTRKNLRVHDIGASDGRTSCSFYGLINQLYGECLDFRASDYAPYLYVLKRTRTRNRLIMDEERHVLQIVAPPFVFFAGPADPSKPYALRPLLRRLATSLVTALYARPLLRDHQAGCSDIERTRLELLCQECRDYIRERDNFRFDRYDVLSGPTEPVDIIRAMNVLNHYYFSEGQLRKAVDNIVESLRDGGLFITGSNTEPGTTVDGGIYQKMRTGLKGIALSGKGSQVDALIG